MGSTNYGSQKLTIDYNADATAQMFNNANYLLSPVGIYSGFSLEYNSNTTISITNGICFIQDSVGLVGTRIETSLSHQLTVSSATPYIILRFTWSNAQENYMDMLAIDYASITSDDLIVGRCVYDNAGTTLLGGIGNNIFDYTRRTLPYTNKARNEASMLRVYPTEPFPTNQVLITSGTLNSSQGNLYVSGGLFPVAGLSNTGANGRIDLIYIDDTGAIQILLGTEGNPAVAPRYGNRKVLAEIRRSGGATNIRGNEIFYILNSFDIATTTSDQLIVDAGNLYSSTNVEDAFQEIAGSAFNYKGDKTFTNGSVSITAEATKVALTVQGAAGQNIETLKKSDGSTIQYNDANGKLINTVGLDIPISDPGAVFTTDKVNEALTQISNEVMTIKGAKTFNDALTLSSTVNKLTLTAPANAATLTLADGSTLIKSGASSLTLTNAGTANLTIPDGNATAITSGNISSQSVNYATTAGSAPASDVYPWAKASTKPTYIKSEVGLGNVDNTADSTKSVLNSSQLTSLSPSSNAAVSTIMSRDSAGRSKVVAPSTYDQIARKDSIYDLLSSAVTYTTFTTMGANTWTRPLGCKDVFFIIAGSAGGGGGGGTWGGGGGGGGNAFLVLRRNVESTPSIAFTLGAGGNGGNSFFNGSSGAVTNFDGLILNGGGGGVHGDSSNAGGAGGTTSLGSNVNYLIISYNHGGNGGVGDTFGGGGGGGGINLANGSNGNGSGGGAGGIGRIPLLLAPIINGSNYILGTGGTGKWGSVYGSTYNNLDYPLNFLSIVPYSSKSGLGGGCGGGGHGTNSFCIAINLFY